MQNSHHPPMFVRQLMAIFYDLLILLGIIFFAAALIIIPYSLIHQGETQLGSKLWFRLYLLVCLCAYYLFFWSWRGQTIAMRTWNFILIDSSGQPPALRTSLLRLILAVMLNSFFLLGLLWKFLDKDKQSLYDRLIKTRLIMTDHR